jgi:hypothetical protein
MLDDSSRPRLGELLVAEGLVTDALVQDALEIQRCLQVHMRLGEIFVYWKVLSSHQVRMVLEKHHLQTSRLGNLLLIAGTVPAEAGPRMSSSS